MNRRDAALAPWLALLCVAGAPLAARAQPTARMHRIGFLSPTAAGSRSEAFVQGLREFGYVEGRNCRIDMRFADGQPDRLQGLAEELVGLPVDVLVVGATIGARAAKKATGTIPIVFAGSSDPVAGGIVPNLSRPGGNVTGFSLAQGDGFAGKWLELLKAAASDANHVAALWSSSNAAATRYLNDLETAAKASKVRLDAHHAAHAAELDEALSAIAKSGARGLIVMPSPFAFFHRDKLVRFAADRRLPAIYYADDFTDAGGLMSYGPSISDSYRRAASHVDKILKGAKPGDLPVEQPTKFDLAINLKTAKALGLTIAPSLLLRADQVIQ